MRLSYSWLKGLVRFRVSPEKLAEILNMHVANVEKIEKLSSGLEKVVVAEIVEIKPHPYANKLQIAIVKTKVGDREKKLEIICGAWNIKVGQKVPLVLPGAKLPSFAKATADKKTSEGEPEGLKIKESVIRGIKSQGMLCAEDELGIGPDHEGIYILPPEAKIGEPIDKVLGLDDTILEVENKSITHRPDLFGHLGFAREISACLRQAKIKDKKPKIKKTNQKLKNFELSIKIEDEKLCPRYMAVVMDGIKVGPSPIWLQNRLRNLGIRPINNIVDITNYVMMAIGQPLHAFDYHKLANIHESDHKFHEYSQKFVPKLVQISEKQIIVRKAKNKEKLVALDGKEYQLNESDLVIADSEKPIALAGVIGGEKSGVTEQTKTIIIESANFEPVIIRRTSWRLGLRTESALRFEKGLPVNFPEIGINRAIELIQKLTAGKVVSEIYDEKCPAVTAKLTQSKKILINLERINKIIGLIPLDSKHLTGQKIEKKEALSIFKSLGFETKEMDLIKTLVKLAKEQPGKPFKLGASTLLEAPNVFDCSSLTRWLYWQIGIELPRISIEQIEIGEPIEINQLRPGDLVFSKGDGRPHYNEKYPNGVGHVGIYLGKGKVIHAKGKKKKVIQTSLKEFASKKDWRGARRIIQIKTGMVIEVPVFRPDLNLEEDLVEEIIRIYGAEKIQPQPIFGELKPVLYEPEFILEREIRNILVGCGFDEVYNYSFTRINTDRNTDQHRLEIANPLNPEQRYLRTSLLPGLIKNAQKNASYFSASLPGQGGGSALGGDEFKIFETGRVFNYKNRTLNQSKRLGGVLISKKGSGLFSPAKGTIELILSKFDLRADDVKYEKMFKNPKADNLLNAIWFNSKTSLLILVNDKVIGAIGSLDPIRTEFKITQPTEIFEIDLEKLFKFGREVIKYQPISAYPPVKRDLAFLIDKKITWQQIFEMVKNINPLIKTVELFDIFDPIRDKKLKVFARPKKAISNGVEDRRFKEKRNLAFHIIYQASNRTLKTEEVEKIEAQIIKILKEKFGAELRNF